MAYAIEYGLIAAIVGVGIIVSLTTLQTGLNTLFNSVNTSRPSKVATGSNRGKWGWRKLARRAEWRKSRPEPPVTEVPSGYLGLFRPTQRHAASGHQHHIEMPTLVASITNRELTGCAPPTTAPSTPTITAQQAQAPGSVHIDSSPSVVTGDATISAVMLRASYLFAGED